MRYLVDTMTFVRSFAQGLDAVPKRVRILLSNPEHEFFLSTISLSEIAIKTSIGKLDFSLEQAKRALSELQFSVLDYKEQHVQTLFTLPWFADHRDPFDRMLIAAAIAQDLPMISGDKHFKRYRALEVIWN